MINADRLALVLVGVLALSTVPAGSLRAAELPALPLPSLSSTNTPSVTAPSTPAGGGAVAPTQSGTNTTSKLVAPSAVPPVVASGLTSPTQSGGGALPVLAGQAVREGSVDEYQNKASGSIKEIAKKLEFGRENVTLRDLNDARQAVMKIDAIIELEKKLTELEKVRKDKEKEKKISILPVSDKSLLPTPPKPVLPLVPELPVTPALPVAAQTPSKPVAPPEPKAAEIEVSRILGGGGTYKALASVDGNEKVLSVGDKLTGGVVVTGVTARGVEVVHKGEKKLYAVKNVATVFGGVF